MTTITIELPAPADATLAHEQLGDLFDCALGTGGADYWARCSRWDDEGAVFYEMDNNGDTIPEKRHKVTRDIMRQGLINIIKARPDRINNCRSSFLLMLVTLGTDDWPDYDAADADVILQFGLDLTWDDNGRKREIYG